jgi:hypothetical protein
MTSAITLIKTVNMREDLLSRLAEAAEVEHNAP